MVELSESEGKEERPDTINLAHQLVAMLFNIGFCEDAITWMANKFMEATAERVYKHGYSRISMAMCMIQRINRNGFGAPFRQHGHQNTELDFVLGEKIWQIRDS